MKDVIADVDAWVARGDEVALATVVDVKRSAPRPPGAKMAVNSRGEVSGAVSGGCVEGALGDPQLDAAAAALGEELMWAERSERREVEGVSLFVDVTAPPPRLIMFGAVDFAGALARMAGAAGWRPYVIDPRGRFATK